jgi:hypothetical protein
VAFGTLQITHRLLGHVSEIGAAYSCNRGEIATFKERKKKMMTKNENLGKQKYRKMQVFVVGFLASWTRALLSKYYIRVYTYLRVEGSRCSTQWRR